MKWLTRQLYGSVRVSLDVRHSVGLVVGYGLLAFGIVTIF